MEDQTQVGGGAERVEAGAEKKSEACASGPAAWAAEHTHSATEKANTPALNNN